MRGVAALEVCSDGLAQFCQSPGNGILIGALEHGFCRRLADLAGRIEVRISLREVNGSAIQRDAGHLPDPALLEMFKLGGGSAPGGHLATGL